MILLDKLGFLKAQILSNLDNKHKAVILANLLNRNEQEIRSMLTYWDGGASKSDYNCKNPDDVDKVEGFILDNGIFNLTKSRVST